MFTKLSEQQIDKKIKFINNYIDAENAATGSIVDANANVSNKNIVTLQSELYKDFSIQIRRKVMYNKLMEIFDKETAEAYINDIETHRIYQNDETGLLLPYCVSITMYPFLIDGLVGLGGESKAPEHLESFCGGLVNLVFAVASQFSGAVSTPEFLTYFNYFCEKDYGMNYLNSEVLVDTTVKNHLQHCVYALNQPAAARNFQCVREDTTQLLTPEGFKYLSELKEGDLCYTAKDGKLKIEKINKLNVYDYDGELLQFCGQNYQQTVTPNHRVVYKKPNTDQLVIKEAHEVFGKSKISMPVTTSEFDREDYPILDELLTLCVITLTDGTITFKDPNDLNTAQLRFYKSKNRWGYKEIPELLNKLGIGFKETDATKNEFGEMSIFTLGVVDARIILRQLMYTKKEVPHFFKLLSRRQAKLVIDIWSKLDGTNDGEHTQQLQCDNDNIRDSIQEIAIIAGLGSTIFDRKMKKFKSDEECIVKYVKIFKRDTKRISKYNKVQYTGKVWCPSTDSGVVIFREENGTPYITGNSVFWNIAIFDEYYFNALFEEFVFPDGTRPNWENVKKLQTLFLSWFNKEREKALLTFPVITCNTLIENNSPKDKYMLDVMSRELSEGNSFFIYQSESIDSLSSCCRLRNELSDNVFSYTLGAGGIATGSVNVITMNINRLIQNKDNIAEQVKRIHKYHFAYREILKNLESVGMLPVYTAGFISLNKQFSTIGINGLVEAAEYLDIEIGVNEKYKNFVNSILEPIYNANKEAKKIYGCMFNTEFIPGESLGVKNAKWDKKDGLESPRECYNSYFYKVESDINVVDKFILHGKDFIKYLDGGSALHLNLEEYPSQEGYKKLLELSAKTGCNYFTTNVKITICNKCGNIDKNTLCSCPKCKSTDIDYATRIIGYLKRISSFSKDRQLEAAKRFYN